MRLTPTQTSVGVGQPSSKVTVINSPNVELTLARCTLAFEVLACRIMATTTSGYTFVIGSFSVAFTPTYTSTVSNNTNQEGEEGQGETGRFFGVLSVLQALG